MNIPNGAANHQQPKLSRSAYFKHAKLRYHIDITVAEITTVAQCKDRISCSLTLHNLLSQRDLLSNNYQPSYLFQGMNSLFVYPERQRVHFRVCPGRKLPEKFSTEWMERSVFVSSYGPGDHAEARQSFVIAINSSMVWDELRDGLIKAWNWSLATALNNVWIEFEQKHKGEDPRYTMVREIIMGKQEELLKSLKN